MSCSLAAMDVTRFHSAERTDHLRNCPRPTDLFFNQSQMFGQDVKELGSGYGTLVHLIVFTVFTLVSFFLQKLVEVNFSIGPQISLFVYYLRMRWGWEEREVTRQLSFSMN